MLCCSTDVDECITAAVQGKLLCTGAQNQCVNQVGSYRCTCPAGTLVTSTVLRDGTVVTQCEGESWLQSMNICGICVYNDVSVCMYVYTMMGAWWRMYACEYIHKQACMYIYTHNIIFLYVMSSSSASGQCWRKGQFYRCCPGWSSFNRSKYSLTWFTYMTL